MQAIGHEGAIEGLHASAVGGFASLRFAAPARGVGEEHGTLGKRRPEANMVSLVALLGGVREAIAEDASFDVFVAGRGQVECIVAAVVESSRGRRTPLSSAEGRPSGREWPCRKGVRLRPDVEVFDVRTGPWPRRLRSCSVSRKSCSFQFSRNTSLFRAHLSVLRSR